MYIHQSFLIISTSLFHQYSGFLRAVCFFLVLAASQDLVMCWTKSLACWFTSLDSLKFSSNINWKSSLSSVSIFHPLVANASHWSWHILTDTHQYRFPDSYLVVGACSKNIFTCNARGLISSGPLLRIHYRIESCLLKCCTLLLHVLIQDI